MTQASQVVDCTSVARELLSQPELLQQLDALGNETASEKLARRYTGVRSTLDEQRMLKVGALRLLGASDREIESVCGVTRRTIPLLLAELEKTGRITPLKERLALLTGDNAEHSNLVLRSLLAKAMDGEVSIELAAMLKAVGTVAGISTEKTLLLTGQATQIVETKVGVGRADFEAWWNDMVRPAQVAETPANDSASAPLAAVPEQIEAPPAPGHEPVTADLADPVPAGPDCPPAVAAAPPRAPVEEAGGGVAPAAGGGGVERG